MSSVYSGNFSQIAGSYADTAAVYSKSETTKTDETCPAPVRRHPAVLLSIMSDFTSISLSEYVRLCSFIAKQRSGNWNIHVPKEGKCRSIGGIRAISGIKRESLFSSHMNL